jgi:hypothetical protein
VDEHAYGSRQGIDVRRGRSARFVFRDLAGLHVLGLVALASVALFATAAALVDSDRSRTVVVVFLAAALAAAALIAGALAWSSGRGAARLPAGLLATAQERASGGWLPLVAGWLVALPVLAFHSRVLVGDSDSGWLLATILYVQREGTDYLVETQQVLLPHLVLGPIVAVGGIPALQAFNVVSVIALAGVVAFLAWRLTGSTVGALAAVLALTALRPILQRASLSPMYPTTLALGFLGLYLAYRAMRAQEPARRWISAALAAICFIGSMETHQIGQLFVVLSVLLILATPSVRAATGLGRVYACLAVLYVPRALINLSDGGLSHFFSNRIDYWTSKGYLVLIQEEMFNYPRELGVFEYARTLPEGLIDVWGATGWLTLALGVASIVFAPARLRRFTVGSTLLLLAVVLHFQLPFFTRYFSVLLVGSALASGVTVAALARRTTFPWRAVAAVAVGGLVVANVVSYHTELDRSQELQAAVLQGPYQQLAQKVRPGDGVIGTRSFYLNNTSTNATAYGGQFLSESEYRTFLTWPSEAEVIRVMRRHDAEWVFVPRWKTRWIAEYNDIWLHAAGGGQARYYEAVKTSPSFCLAKRVHGTLLYRLDPGGPRVHRRQGPPRCGD